MSHYLMPAANAAALLRALDEHGVDVYVGGGWGVDALLGEQTREHSDRDGWLEASALEVYESFGDTIQYGSVLDSFRLPREALSHRG